MYFIVSSFFILFIGLFFILLRQSKKPSGRLGLMMMRLWNKVYLPLVQWSTHFLSLEKELVILDIGVGNGASTNYLHQTFRPARITGIDLAPTAIKEAGKHYPNLQFAVMNVQQLDFSSESVDLVTAFQTHFHWEDLDQALTEISRILKTKGLLLLACETTKINYYLPEYRDSEAFYTHLKQFDLGLQQHHTTNQWTMYSFQKAQKSEIS
ncbi:class I SAM-dependent methyltransferase [Enterococcus sp. UD-01]|uniref:class I SAM-dependent methyltransferase n=1 Tax=Enterococcus sp. UD-01 TaxID=3373911 RepID=UPI0038365320